MQSKVIAFNNEKRAQSANASMPLRSGDVVKVHRKIKEGNKERIQIFEGMIIAVKGAQSSSRTITVRKVSPGGYGVEIVVPVNSPMIEKIDLVKRAKVRRSKLYYVRDKAAKALRFKFTDAKDLKLPEVAVATAATQEKSEEKLEEDKKEEGEEAKEEKPEEDKKEQVKDQDKA